jgi:hypothetical protein
MRFSAFLARLFVHCVLACTSPVAVRVAVGSRSSIGGGEELIEGAFRAVVAVVFACKRTPCGYGEMQRTSEPLASDDFRRKFLLCTRANRAKDGEEAHSPHT